MSNRYYESYTFDLEPATLHALQELIFAHAPRDDSATSAELLNLSNEIRARLQKIAFHACGTPPASCDMECAAQTPEPDWLAT